MKIEIDTEILSSTPTIPPSTFEKLPPLLKEIMDKFEDPREKDVVLTSSLSILSGCFNKIEGLYGNDKHYPNLYSFIVAPPASGKGVMKYAQRLGSVIQRKLIKANVEAKGKYDAEYQTWKKQLRRSASGADAPPQKPKYPVLFIPGNTSAASIYKRLYESNGTGIICESEADTLSNAIKQDWGNFSDLMRKAFHHEALSLTRSGEDLYIHIERPRPSFLLTGTPNQVSRLIVSPQDGLFSRFIFYCYSQPLEWNDPTPCDACPDLSEYFESQGEIIAAIEQQLSGGAYSFKLTKDQFAILSDNFRKKLEAIKLFDEEEAASTVKRLGLIAFRIAMILTVLRSKDSLEGNPILECSEEDFKTAMALVDVYFEHAMVMYFLLPNAAKTDLSPKIRQFYCLLPKGEKLPRKKADEIGKSIGIKERTVGTYLDKLIEKELLFKPEYGYYQKEEDEQRIAS